LWGVNQTDYDTEIDLTLKRNLTPSICQTKDLPNKEGESKERASGAQSEAMYTQWYTM
jgi:hypothetical protein